MQTKIGYLGLGLGIFWFVGLVPAMASTTENLRLKIPFYTCTLKINGTQAGMSGSIIVDAQHLESGTYLGINQNQDGIHDNRFAGEVIAGATGGKFNFLLWIKENGEFTTGFRGVYVGVPIVNAVYKSDDGQKVELECIFDRL